MRPGATLAGRPSRRGRGAGAFRRRLSQRDGHGCLRHPPGHRFAMWDWVGGRYSMWSSIGVSLAIADRRRALQRVPAGGAAMDAHFRTAPWDQNLPVLMALLGVWNINFLELPTLAVLPYDDRLARFPAYLQQLDMESNGKSRRIDGRRCARDRAGRLGRARQQCPAFVLPAAAPGHATRCARFHAARSVVVRRRAMRSDLAIANCLAQAEAFAHGQARARRARSKVHEGNRPASPAAVPRA